MSQLTTPELGYSSGGLLSLFLDIHDVDFLLKVGMKLLTELRSGETRASATENWVQLAEMGVIPNWAGRRFADLETEIFGIAEGCPPISQSSVAFLHLIESETPPPD